MMVGAATAVTVADAVRPVPPFVEDTVPVVFVKLPPAVAVTLTEAVQVPPAAMVPPLKLTVVAPAAGDQVGEPQPLLVAPGVEAT